MEPFSILLNNILLVVAIVLFMNDSIILFVRGKNNRARRMLGTTTLIWGLMYGFFLYCSLKGLITYPIFCGEAFISSHFFICVMFFFPLEVLSPGWLNLKRLIIMLTPMTLLAIGYVVGLKLTGQRIEQFYTFTDFFNAMGRFNVWYRWILLICNCIFLFGLMKMLQKRELKYLKWQNDNFSDLDSVDISWLHYYWRMMMIIIVCYLVVAVWGSVWSIIAHTVIVIVCFSIMVYKGVFYEHSYPQYIVNEGFTTPRSCVRSSVLEEESILLDKEIDESVNDSTFETKLPEYVATLVQWLEEEKPYLYKDFKLIDVARVLPLNRTYLSRVFNEGFHQNFSEVVRHYRIESAKQLLMDYPDSTLYRVAELCGFNSDATFFRAFKKETGRSPKEYQEEMTKKSPSCVPKTKGQ